MKKQKNIVFSILWSFIGSTKWNVTAGGAPTWTSGVSEWTHLNWVRVPAKNTEPSVSLSHFLSQFLGAWNGTYFVFKHFFLSLKA